MQPFEVALGQMGMSPSIAKADTGWVMHEYCMGVAWVNHGVRTPQVSDIGT